MHPAFTKLSPMAVRTSTGVGIRQGSHAVAANVKLWFNWPKGQISRAEPQIKHPCFIELVHCRMD